MNIKAIQENIIDKAAKDLSDDIDFEVLTSCFVESGWTKIVLKPMTWEDGLEIDGWVEQHVKNPHITRGLVWVFKDPKEANWFKLRWI
jgi:hypothetical protein